MDVTGNALNLACSMSAVPLLLQRQRAALLLQRQGHNKKWPQSLRGGHAVRDPAPLNGTDDLRHLEHESSSA